MKHISILILVSLFLASCGGGGSSKSSVKIKKTLDGRWDFPCIFYNESGFSEKNIININGASFIKNTSMYKTSDCSGEVENKIILKGEIDYKGEYPTSICISEKIDITYLDVILNNKKLTTDRLKKIPILNPIYDISCIIENQIKFGIENEKLNKSSDKKRPVFINTSNIALFFNDLDKDGIIDIKDQCPNTPKGTSANNVGCKIVDKDTDQDGVPDSKDQCPNTLKGTSVNSVGCKIVDKDTDQDGVPDSKDQCPNTPKGTSVNSVGCKIVDKDTDQDGVPDSKDQCPNTPEGTSVNSVGCKIDKDTDQDGVPDSKDQCPNTPKGTSVNSVGCKTMSYICGNKKYCSEMSSCAEAEYYLFSCGLSRLDRDKDGIPCESLCN